MERVAGKKAYPVREVDAAPYAAALIEGHRDFGYSLETALADVIDNSISAGAKTIQLIASTAVEKPVIALADNGSGMSETELIEAMRLGSKNPKDVRAIDDLGRFGLGLKSASFSQCRSLTVLTRKNGKVSCARWDLDRISRRNDWSLELIDHPESTVGYELLSETGTVVIWEKLDRLIDGFGEDRPKRTSYMNAELGRAERHLRLVFHRFLEGRNPKLTLFLNDRELKPIDPMAASHPATQKDPEEVLQLSKGNVRIRCYTLPHHKKITRDEWEETGGPEGYLKSQGLYIYRENRLIIAGGWLGLARQTELTKLCRIAVDIPNTMDAEWKIDVKKASAQLPPLVRERLKKVVERFVGTSKRTYRRRGQKLVDETKHPIWTRVQQDGEISFRPNLDHPVFKAYSDKLPEGLRDGFKRCLRLVGSGLPVETLHAELVGNAEMVVADEAGEEDLRQMVYATADALIRNGVEADSLSDTLQSHPFLRSNWYVAKQIIEEYLREGNA
ncbi:ATP-binding protein [Marinobacter salexigens]|uniref:ATP-binding protein n=1 Tax=Marinobacter salexigens TaxID=1925763 RepID=UPI000C28BAA3|nr:ATP-binding protein [Marinobacter salexigens]